MRPPISGQLGVVTTAVREGPVKVLVIDEQPLFRHGIIAVLNSNERFQVVGQASHGNDAMQKITELRPDVIVIGVDTGPGHATEFIKSLRETTFSKNLKVLAVSGENGSLFQAIKAGVDGYISKNTELGDLINALTHVSKGESILSPSVTATVLRQFRRMSKKRTLAAQPNGPLSDREKEIAKLVAEGNSNKEIASSLFVTQYTVKAHMRSILRKLKLRNRCQVAAWVAREGFVTTNGPTQDV